ncbi:hypothetical protein AB0H43_21910 [Hamadaea sp. NPDC050747]|uniref:hypothetical protein n=1 Tax=Hamadaea sp. NPDC050747 TaxID=3155789 RepID=UPI0033D632E8
MLLVATRWGTMNNVSRLSLLPSVQSAVSEGPRLPLVVLAPYLPLRDPLSLGDWLIVPFNRWTREFCVSEQVASRVEALITATRVSDGPVGGVCLRPDGRIGQPVEADLVTALARGLLVAALSGNPRVEEYATRRSQFEVQDTITSENARVICVAIDAPEVSAHSGSLVRRTVTNFVRGGEPFQVSAPADLYVPDSACDPRGNAGSVVYQAMLVGGADARRLDTVIRTVEALAANDTNITFELRVLGFRSAFEVLLDSDSSRVMRDRVGQLFPPEPTQLRTWTERGREHSAELTSTQWAFQTFTMLRNAIAHGHRVLPSTAYFGSASLDRYARQLIVDLIPRVAEQIVADASGLDPGGVAERSMEPEVPRPFGEALSPAMPWLFGNLLGVDLEAVDESQLDLFAQRLDGAIAALDEDAPPLVDDGAVVASSEDAPAPTGDGDASEAYWPWTLAEIELSVRRILAVRRGTEDDIEAYFGCLLDTGAMRGNHGDLEGTASAFSEAVEAAEGMALTPFYQVSALSRMGDLLMFLDCPEPATILLRRCRSLITELLDDSDLTAEQCALINEYRELVNEHLGTT